MFTLPDDAPTSLADLLSKWLDISQSHKPTKSDLRFDELVKEHGGLFWVERTDESPLDFDLRFIATGPEVKKRNRDELDGKLYSEVLSPRAFSYVPGIFGNSLYTGTPHYWDITSVEYGKEAVWYRRLLLPLFDYQGLAVSLLGCIVWGEEN